jgi:DNA transformation protein and related proteins
MDAEGLKELFEPFGQVTVKRMFGGAGVYTEGLCFAIEQDGEVFLKTDPLTQPSFAAAGSSPFVYVAKGKPMAMSFWRLPAAAHEEADELRRWSSLGLEAARRAAEAKAKPKARKPAKSRAIGRGQRR